MLALLALVAAAAAPDAATLQQGWEAYRPALDARAKYPFRLDAAAWAELAQGRVYRRRDRLDGTDRVLGVRWIAADLDTTWVAVQDPHGDDYVDGYVHEELPGSTFQQRLLYQRIALPWPLQARQWVILVQNNLGLIGQTQGAVWERTWDLSDRRGAKAEDPKAVWLPVNEGGWFLARVGGGTLLGYHVRTSVGGVVPDEAAVRWSFSTLTKMLERIAGRTGWVREHYTGDHAPLRRPDGTEIDRFGG
ncbi:MAG: hypothetical protein R3F59_22970 [Myxococcota bacterium]